MRRARSVASGLTAVTCAVAVLSGGGCARIVTIDPANVAKYNDVRWNIVRQPSAEPAPAAAAASPGAQPAALAEPDSQPVTPVAAAPSPPMPPAFGLRPEVQAALASAKDDLGVPKGLYAVDPLLTARRREMDAQASARHTVATGTIIFGLLTGGLAAWGISYGMSHTNSPNPDQRSSAEQLVVYGWIMAGLSAGELIAGLVMAGSSSDPTPLQRYYRETYAAPR